MKWLKITFILFCITMGCLLGLSKYSLPNIIFPKSAQHNTIGELPIVEMADDGVFAEVDGAESTVDEIMEKERKRQAERRATRADRCYGVISSVCGYYYKDKSRRQVRREQRKYRKCIDKSYNKDGTPIFDGDGWQLGDKCRANKGYWGKPPVFKDSETCFEKARNLCDAYNGEVACSSISDFGLGMYTCWGTFE